MSRQRPRPPRWAESLLRRRLPGPIGEDACADLAHEFERVHERRGGLVATAWYASHLMRPSTWTLSRSLRQSSSPSARLRGGASIFSWLDVKLGVRMLLKHPGLTLISGFAMSVTIAIAIGTFSIFQDYLLRPTLPLPEGDRVVSLGMLATDRRVSYRQLLHDFPIWRDELETVRDVSISRVHMENVLGADGVAELSSFSMMSAAGFEVAGVPPLLGRPLVAADEVPGAEPVVVLGYEDWMTRYGGRPDLLGTTMQIGDREHTIVGVMPDEYRFPHSARRWLPFTDDPDDYAVMESPHIYYAFGRLAPGVTMEVANAELSAIANRRAEQYPDTHGNVTALVMSYTDAYTGLDNFTGSTFLVRMLLGFLSLLVVVPFVNVAILIYARTATRAGELSVRTALGAGRTRIVSQLFVEALVLASLSAIAGVFLVLYAFGQADAILANVGDGGGWPFWAKQGRDPWVAAYVIGLTLLAAVVAGVIPGLKATGRGVQQRLNRAASGNGMRLGRAWTALIVFQVATTVGFIPFAASMSWQILGIGLTGPNFEAQSLVGTFVGGPLQATSAEALASADPTDDRADTRERAHLAIEELIRQVEADGRVVDVTLSTDVPGTLFGSSFLVEVEGIAPPTDRPAHRVGGEMAVAEDFFDALGVVPVAGRFLHRTDLAAETEPLVVNMAFVDEVLGGENAVGRRVRVYRAEDGDPAPWREIVGVVDNLTLNPTHPERVEARLYRPLDPAGLALGTFLIVKVPEDPQAFVPELRRMATAIDPTIVVGTAVQLGDIGTVVSSMVSVASLGFAIVVLSGLLLCSAGVFALMSFNVTQRRREIGVRSALGAHPRKVLAGIMLRSLRQLAVGVAVGLVIVISVPPINADGIIVDATLGPIAFVAVFMVVVGLLAAVGPTRRGLRVHPSEALREG